MWGLIPLTILDRGSTTGACLITLSNTEDRERRRKSENDRNLESRWEVYEQKRPEYEAEMRGMAVGDKQGTRE